MFTRLKSWVTRNTHAQRRAIYLRKRADLPTSTTDILQTGRLTLLREFAPEITFTRYTAAVGERTVYRGLYSRADGLISAIGVAFTAIDQLREAALLDVPVDNHREFTLDYFLSTREDHILTPASVFQQLCQWLFEIDDALSALESQNLPRYQYYTLRYNFLFLDVIGALEALAAVSDLCTTSADT